MKPEIFNVPQDNLELLNLWENLKERFSIISIQPVFYQGRSADSEIINYDPNVLFLLLKYSASYWSANNVANAALVTFYDETNSPTLNCSNVQVIYDSTAVVYRFSNQIISIDNVYCSRVVNGIYDKIRYIGYKIIIQP